MEFVNSPIKPGTNATIRVSGDSGSACSIGVVDKSIELLKADHQLTPEKVEHIQILLIVATFSLSKCFSFPWNANKSIILLKYNQFSNESQTRRSVVLIHTAMFSDLTFLCMRHNSKRQI